MGTQCPPALVGWDRGMPTGRGALGELHPPVGDIGVVPVLQEDVTHVFGGVQPQRLRPLPALQAGDTCGGGQGQRGPGQRFGGVRRGALTGAWPVFPSEVEAPQHLQERLVRGGRRGRLGGRGSAAPGLGTALGLGPAQGSPPPPREGVGDAPGLLHGPAGQCAGDGGPGNRQRGRPAPGARRPEAAELGWTGEPPLSPPPGGPRHPRVPFHPMPAVPTTLGTVTPHTVNSAVVPVTLRTVTPPSCFQYPGYCHPQAVLVTRSTVVPLPAVPVTPRLSPSLP